MIVGINDALKAIAYALLVLFFVIGVMKTKARLPTHINIRAADTGLAKDSVVLLEQIRTLDKHRLRERAGQITPEDQRRVNQALDVSLGLDSY